MEDIIMGVQIIVDSACDLSKEEAKELNIRVLPLKTYFGETEYLDGVTLSQQEFFEKLIESDVLPTTSQVSPYEFEEAYKEAIDAGNEIICITVSGKLSGTNQSAHIAADEYENQVYVVDSNNVTVGEQLLVKYAARLRDAGLTAQEIVTELELKKEKIRVVALLDTLEYLKKGGRVSATAAFAGTLLSIKPVVCVEDGSISVLGKARGSKNGNNFLVQYIEKGSGIDFDMPYSLAYSGLSDELLKKYIADSNHLYACDASELPVCKIGSTIGTHVGPGAIAVGYFEK